MEKWDRKFFVRNGIVGFIAGIISGLFASGGGLVLVPAFCFFCGMDEKKSRGTSIFCVLFLVIVSGLIYFKGNFIDWGVGIKCALGGVVGGWIGSKLLKRLNEEALKAIFIVFLGYVSIKMLFF